jgi:predicted O-methyltransferase YrrM
MTTFPNWFAENGLKNFETHLTNNLFPQNFKFLQIGAYTGDASVWLAENLLAAPNSSLVDVDTWGGSNESAHHVMNWDTVESVYDAKTKQHRLDRKIIKYKGTSDSFFLNNREKYDFIYIDGDHTSYGVLKDAVAAYEVLNVGGIIAFDDYEWTGAFDLVDRPKMAIDYFLNIYNKRLSIILKDYQCWIRKVA